MCATACAPSTSTGMPRACAFSTIVAIGLIVPSEFDTWTTATIFVRSVSRPSSRSIRSSPSSVIGSTFRCAPFSSQMSCQGTMFEWCSISVMSTSSPLPMFARPNVCATRLIASVVPRTKMISREFGALRNF